VVPVRRRKDGSGSVLVCFHWEGEEDVFHSFVYLSCEIVDSNDTFFFFWKTRGRTGRDFKHLLGCAAFLRQLAKRKLFDLGDGYEVLVHSYIESLKVEFAFLKV
jgi:hypothetical protein